MKMRFYLFVAIAVVGAVQAQAQEKIDFVGQVKPIFEAYCVSCHNEAHAHENGNYRMDIKSEAFKPKRNKQRIVPGDPEKSQVYALTILPADDGDLMPPTEKAGPLPKHVTEVIRRWIAEGAEWPEDLKLKTAMRVDFARDVKHNKKKGSPLDDKARETLRLWVDQGTIWPEGVQLAGVASAEDADPEMKLIREMHQKITANTKVQSEAEMKPYTDTVSDDVKFEMLPIPGGEFLMGSPTSEPGRKPDEGPQFKVKLDPFWMAKTEVTWDEYEQFMYPDPAKAAANPYASDVADATARPTKPYVEMSFGMGKGGFPAISMTQHAANKYCQWLSARTGHFYRLPTEAEWEYACRAGTTTAYSFGDDPSQIGEFAWFGDNSDLKYQKVGKKKPNPWGLHDMHGNVAEWCLDQYDPNWYIQFQSTGAVNPWNKADKPYPHVARGGSWDDDPVKLRSAARRASDPSWKQQDPQLPKSIWYHTDAQFLGFRVVRPLKVPTPEEMNRYWNSGVERD